MRPTLLVVAPLLTLLAACGPPSTGSMASARAANEFSCPEQQITSQELAPDTVRVNACGHIAVYTCPVTRDPDAVVRNWTRSCIREANPTQ